MLINTDKTGILLSRFPICFHFFLLFVSVKIKTQICYFVCNRLTSVQQHVQQLSALRAGSVGRHGSVSALKRRGAQRHRQQRRQIRRTAQRFEAGRTLEINLSRPP